MKNEKLELLLNKVVEFNQPEVAYYKGFLQKNSGGYYIKVSESIIGSFLERSNVYLKEGDEQYITKAEKPKLMRVSLKSWHYRLVKYVLKDNVPTPKTMQNGCPYFWLLIFSLLVLPIVLSWKIFITILTFLPKYYFKGLEALANNWLKNISDEQAYDIYNGYYNKKIPLTAKLYFKNKDGGGYYSNLDRIMFEQFLEKNYGIIRSTNNDEYIKKREEIAEKWEEYRNKIYAERRKLSEEKYRLDSERRLVEMKREKLRKEKIEKFERAMKPLYDGISSIFSQIRKTFTFNLDWKNIIKRTKQIVGAIITLLILTGTFFFVEAMVHLTMIFVKFSIENWYIYAALGILALFVCIVYLFITFFTGWIQNIISKYDGGKKVWYVEPLKFIVTYVIFYPCKYIALFMWYVILTILWIPIKYFYLYILKKIGIILGNGFKSLYNNVIGSTGIFGEYFDASYTDYCPGIEWVDTEEDEIE
jgi:hypothetical protein